MARRIFWGNKVADVVSSAVGTWKFIVVQTLVIFGWVLINIKIGAQGFDPSPFILLNLVMSIQAVYTAPLLLMSENRRQQLEQRKIEEDRRLTVKAEREIQVILKYIHDLQKREHNTHAS